MTTREIVAYENSATGEQVRLCEHSTRVGAIEERNCNEQEIHDALVQGLSAIGLQLECADALLETPERTEYARKAVRLALSLARSNLQEARESVPDLRSTHRDGCGPEQVLRHDAVAQREGCAPLRPSRQR